MAEDALPLTKSNLTMAKACVWYFGLLFSEFDNSQSTTLTTTCPRLDPATANKSISHNASSDASLDDYESCEEIRGYQAVDTLLTSSSLN